MIKRIDHIGIAVANIDDALKFYRDVFGLNLERTDTESSQKSVVAFMPVGSDEVELIEPIGEDGPVALLLSRQEGEPRAILAAVRELAAATGVNGMVGGQYIDVAATAPEASRRIAQTVSLDRPSASNSALSLALRLRYSVL